MKQNAANTKGNPEPLTVEQKWFASLDGFRVVREELEQKAEAERLRAEAQVESLRNAFGQLPAAPADCKVAVDSLSQSFKTIAVDWIQQWGENELARQLSDAYADRLVLLVLGKVNAGKSSLINFLASRAAEYGLTVQRFVFDNGKRADRVGDFQVGATETTSTLQGVEIGQRLLLLDSPGLHSVTPANQALTERFMAAADGALLLTNAGAPGGRTEMSMLVEDLTASQRPVLIAITRSDENEDDEVDGQLVSRLINKPAADREDQETYVMNSAREALLATGCSDDDLARLWAPVSVSVNYADEHSATTEALTAAGFDRLFEALHDLAEQALTYKRHKPLQLVHEHQRRLQARLKDEVLPRLSSVRQAGASASEALAARAPALVETLAATGLRQLFEVLQRHTSDRDITAAIEDLQAELNEDLLREVEELTASYSAELQNAMVAIDPQGVGGYDEDYVSFEQTRGSAWRGVGSTAGAMAGAAAGSFIPGLGTLIGAGIGALVGGLGGRAIGGLGVRTETVKELVGVSFEQVQASVAPRMEQAIELAVGKVLADCRATIERLDDHITLIEQELSAFADETRPEETGR